MLALCRTIVFLVRGSFLRFSNVERVVRDFYEDSIEEGHYFSFEEIKEIGSVIKDPFYFCGSYLFEEFFPYALPFFEKETLKRTEDYL